MAKIVELRGNLFESTCKTIVNAVNCVGVMGKGIALEFKNRYPAMYEEYKSHCENGNLKPGILWLYKREEKWILCFPTKINWKHPAKIEYIQKGLEKFRLIYREKQITSIAFPRLGCSLGGLSWPEVREEFYKILSPLPNLEIEIYDFDPNSGDSLCDKFLQVVFRFEVVDIINHLKIPKGQARILHGAIQGKKIQTMLDLQDLKGFGEKSIELVYKFLSKPHQRILTDSEQNPTLLFGDQNDPK